MTYQVPQHISKDKIFIVNRSVIDNRLDAQYYSANLDLSGFVKLSYVAIVKGGKRIPKGYGYSNEQTPYHYLRVADMDSDAQVEVNNLMNISEEVFNILERYEISEGELAISIAGTIGKTTILKNIPADKRVILTENCAKILARPNVNLLPEYLKICLELPIVKKQLDLNYIQTTIPKLGLDKIVGIKIPPIPCMQKQQEIVDFINEAYTQKRAKEVEAQQLLDSIDGYLLKELGITIPNVDNELNNRIFFSSFNKIEGNRIDPKKYSTKVRNLCAAILNANYETKELNRFIVDSCSGDWGTEDCEDYNRDTHIRCLTLRGTEIDNQYNISINKDKAKTRLIKIDTYRKMSIATGDIIVEKSGGSEEQPVGRVAFIDNELLELYNIGFSNFLFKFKVKGIDPLYLYFYLKTMYNIGVTDSMQSQTNGIRNLIVKEFLSQIVVKPPYLKQQEIVDYITNIQTRAKALQAEGKAILEDAKLKVEEMILGE